MKIASIIFIFLSNIVFNNIILTMFINGKHPIEWYGEEMLNSSPFGRSKVEMNGKILDQLVSVLLIVFVFVSFVFVLIYYPLMGFFFFGNEWCVFPVLKLAMRMILTLTTVLLRQWCIVQSLSLRCIHNCRIGIQTFRHSVAYDIDQTFKHSFHIYIFFGWRFEEFQSQLLGQLFTTFEWDHSFIIHVTFVSHQNHLCIVPWISFNLSYPETIIIIYSYIN